MKKYLHLFLSLFVASQLFGQDFTGQWKGQFTDNSTSFAGWGGNKCDYVLEIECKAKNVTGYSYTYFNEGGKRFYTICRLTGVINKASKYIELTEVERTKTNVPNSIRNCFQIHRLTYFQQEENQTLEGTWVPAPSQEGDCGYGSTSLSRRMLQKNPALVTTNLTKNNKPETKAAGKEKNSTPLVRSVPKSGIPGQDTKTDPGIGEINRSPVTPDLKTDVSPKKDPGIKFESRNNNVLKTIEIENETFKVDLYDNGEIDGDSISLFYNNKLILLHKRLSDKAISLTLRVDDNKDLNELIMYAENLGEIPPNTALMVVTDGDNRYEVRIASDLQKSGVIRFIHKPKNGQ